VLHSDSFISVLSVRFLMVFEYRADSWCLSVLIYSFPIGLGGIIHLRCSYSFQFVVILPPMKLQYYCMIELF